MVVARVTLLWIEIEYDLKNLPRKALHLTEGEWAV
jgi:hypothetical protein